MKKLTIISAMLLALAACKKEKTPPAGPSNQKPCYKYFDFKTVGVYYDDPEMPGGHITMIVSDSLGPTGGHVMLIDRLDRFHQIWVDYHCAADPNYLNIDSLHIVQEGHQYDLLLKGDDPATAEKEQYLVWNKRFTFRYVIDNTPYYLSEGVPLVHEEHQVWF